MAVDRHERFFEMIRKLFSPAPINRLVMNPEVLDQTDKTKRTKMKRLKQKRKQRYL